MYNASEMYCDRLRFASGRRHVALVEIAQRRPRGFRFLRIPQISLHLRPHVAAGCVRDRQILIVATGIQRRQHRKNRLAAVQRDQRLVLRNLRRPALRSLVLRSLVFWRLFLRSLLLRGRLVF